MSLAAALDQSDFVQQIDSLVSADGSVAHSYVVSRQLIEGRDATRNLADAVHFFCLLHGRHPGVVDYAAERVVDDAARHWADTAVSAFVRERAYLTTLASAAGPMPSTPGQQQCEATVLAQGHALDMLGQSERAGCAMGALVALTLDWRAVRAVLNAAGARLDVAARPAALPDLNETSALIASYSNDTAYQRAFVFGAEQLLAQHRGLWDLLAARVDARRH